MTRREVPLSWSCSACMRMTLPGIFSDRAAGSISIYHSITSSASCWRCKGTSRPIALAVLRLMTNSNLVGACNCKLDGDCLEGLRPGAKRFHRSVHVFLLYLVNAFRHVHLPTAFPGSDWQL